MRMRKLWKINNPNTKNENKNAYIDKAKEKGYVYIVSSNAYDLLKIGSSS